jgi:hypothetical protein
LIARLKVYLALSWQQAQVQRYGAPMMRDTLFPTLLIGAGIATAAWAGFLIWTVAGMFIYGL